MMSTPAENSKQSVDLNKFVIPMEVFRTCLDSFDMSPYVTEKSKGPIEAVRLLVSIVQCTLTKAEKVGIDLKNIKFSLIKQAKIDNHRMYTTSVSMGVAEEYFANLLDDEHRESMVALINNLGTGGSKVAGYAWTKSLGTHCIFDDLKGHEGVASPSSTYGVFGSYSAPKKKNVATKEETVLTREEQMIRERLASQKYLELAEKKCEELGIDVANHVQRLAFITGPVREAWEMASTSERKAMESASQQYMTFLTGSDVLMYDRCAQDEFKRYVYFMPQSQEASYEQLGVKTMHHNLHKAGLLTKENSSVIGSCGIGRGSTQFLSIQSRYGMDRIDTFASDVLEDVCENLWELFELLHIAQTQGKTVIGLKSGFLIFFESNAAFQNHIRSLASNYAFDQMLGGEIKMHIGSEPSGETVDSQVLSLSDNNVGREHKKQKIDEMLERVQYHQHYAKLAFEQLTKLLKDAF